MTVKNYAFATASCGPWYIEAFLDENQEIQVILINADQYQLANRGHKTSM